MSFIIGLMKLQDKPTADEMADMIYYDNLKLLSGSVELAKDLSFYECKSNGTKATCSKSDAIPFLSPKLAKLTGPNDLFNYWKSGIHASQGSIKSEL